MLNLCTSTGSGSPLLTLPFLSWAGVKGHVKLLSVAYLVDSPFHLSSAFYRCLHVADRQHSTQMSHSSED